METIEKTREELERLLGEFDEEHDRARRPLVEALKKLTGSKGSRRGHGRPQTSKVKASGAPEARRRRSGRVARREQMLMILDEKPGASSKTVSEALGIASSYVYRIKGELEKEGLIESEGRSLKLTISGAKTVDDIRRQFAAGEGSGSKASAEASRGRPRRKAKAKTKR